MGISIIPVTKAPPLELQNPDTTSTPYPEFQQLQKFGKKKNKKKNKQTNKKQQHEVKSSRKQVTNVWRTFMWTDRGHDHPHLPLHMYMYTGLAVGLPALVSDISIPHTFQSL